LPNLHSYSVGHHFLTTTISIQELANLIMWVVNQHIVTQKRFKFDQSAFPELYHSER